MDCPTILPLIPKNVIFEKIIASVYSSFCLKIVYFYREEEEKNLFCAYRLSLKILCWWTANKCIFKVGLSSPCDWGILSGSAVTLFVGILSQRVPFNGRLSTEGLKCKIQDTRKLWCGSVLVPVDGGKSGLNLFEVSSSLPKWNASEEAKAFNALFSFKSLITWLLDRITVAL